MKQIKVEDILSYTFLSGLSVSPDGKKAVFAGSSANEIDNSYDSSLYLCDEDLQIRQLTAPEAGRSFYWLDENRLLLPRIRTEAQKKRKEAGEEFTVLYCLDLRGGEAMIWKELPFELEDLKVLDESHLALKGKTNVHTPNLWKGTAAEKDAAARKQKEEKDYEVFDESPFWANGQGIVNGFRSALFILNLKTDKLVRISEPAEDVGAMAVCGDELFYDGVCWQRQKPLFFCRIQAARSNAHVRTVFEGNLSVSRMAAVNGELWLSATEGKRYGLNENNFLYRLDPVSGALSILREEEDSMYGSVGSDCRLGTGPQQAVFGKKLYCIQTLGGNAVLHRFSEDGSNTAVFEKNGSIDSIQVLADGTILMTAMFDHVLQELYAYTPSLDKCTRLSNFNEAALRGHYVSVPQPFSTRSGDLTIQGWVLYPKDYDAAKTYPAVFDIHGGPKTVYGPVFYHEMQVWAGKGYFVYFCNPKGSDGGGNRFADIYGHYGETDYQNLMDFSDAVLQAYPQIDRDRVCVTGGSYGGFMTNWVIGHTDRFCCAASQRSISNWTSFWGVSDIGPFFASDQVRGDLFSDLQPLWKQSPLAYAAACTTPTLFIHSDEDYRCPLEQGVQMFTALRTHGVETRLVLFHGENHELSRSGKPSHRIRRLNEITRWFDRFTETEGDNI